MDSEERVNLLDKTQSNLDKVDVEQDSLDQLLDDEGPRDNYCGVNEYSVLKLLRSLTFYAYCLALALTTYFLYVLIDGYVMDLTVNTRVETTLLPSTSIPIPKLTFCRKSLSAFDEFRRTLSRVELTDFGTPDILPFVVSNITSFIESSTSFFSKGVYNCMTVDIGKYKSSLSHYSVRDLESSSEKLLYSFEFSSISKPSDLYMFLGDLSSPAVVISDGEYYQGSFDFDAFQNNVDGHDYESGESSSQVVCVWKCLKKIARDLNVTIHREVSVFEDEMHLYQRADYANSTMTETCDAECGKPDEYKPRFLSDKLRQFVMFVNGTTTKVEWLITKTRGTIRTVNYRLSWLMFILNLLAALDIIYGVNVVMVLTFRTTLVSLRNRIFGNPRR